MRNVRAWVAYGALVVLALAAALAAGSGDAESQAASALNHGPRGLAALYQWYEANGVQVSQHSGLFTELPEGTRALVIAAPTAGEIRPEETQALDRFVRAGGTLVYLSPRPRLLQPAMARWLELESGELPPMDDLEGVQDLGGATAAVQLPGGLAQGMKQVRVSAERMLNLPADDAVPVAASGVLWWKALGQGEVWIGSGADLAENSRLELLDNARFWQNLAARAPIVFDEGHHTGALKPRMARNITATLLQFGFCALVFVAALGTRLGPPRATLSTRHRSGLEYVEAMAGLMRGAHVEAEVVTSLRRQARLLLFDQLGLSPELPWADAAREAQRHAGIPEADVLRLETEPDLLELTRALARLEAKLTGRRS